MKINIDDIEKITNLLCKHLKESGYQEIDLSNLGYVWTTTKDQEHDPYNEPTIHELRDLSEDWEGLSMIINGKKEPVGYAMVWLASILRAVGQNVAC